MEAVSLKKRVLCLWEENRHQLHPQQELGYVPYFNLGRLYASKGMLRHAVRELEQALYLSPGEPSCSAVLQHIKKILN